MSPASGDFAGCVVVSQYRGFVVRVPAAWLFVVKWVVFAGLFLACGMTMLSRTAACWGRDCVGGD